MTRYTKEVRDTAEDVTPAAQATTDSHADVVGSTLDTQWNDYASYTILNSHASNDLDWKVLASNDNTNFAEVQAEATVQETASSSFSTVAYFRYYKVQVKSSVNATPAEATLIGMTK